MEFLSKAAIFFVLTSPNLYFAQKRFDSDTCNVVLVSDSEMEEMETTLSKKSKAGDQPLPAEHRLYNHLIGLEKTKNYVRQIRPVLDYNSQVVLKFGICLMSIDDIIEKDQSLVSTGCIKMKWTDELLTWNPADFDNLTWIIIPSDKIWIPDIAMVNSPDPFSLAKKPSNVELSFNGRVGYYPTGRFYTRCPVRLSYFPFDEQICEYHFESWIYPSRQVKIDLWPGQPVDLKGYISNHQWRLKGINTKLHSKYYDGLEFDAVTFQFHFRRRSLYYTVYAIVPSLLMAFLQLISGHLPVEHPGRMGLLTALFIGFNVLQGYIASSMPKSSDGVSLVQSYDMICSLTLVYSIVQTAINMHIFYRTPEHRKPSILALMNSFFITFGIIPEQTGVSCSTVHLKGSSTTAMSTMSKDAGMRLLRYRLVSTTSPDIFSGQSNAAFGEEASKQKPMTTEEKEAAEKASKQNNRHQWLLFSAKFDRISFYGLLFLHVVSPIYLFAITPAFQGYHAESKGDLGYMAHDG